MATYDIKVNYSIKYLDGNTKQGDFTVHAWYDKRAILSEIAYREPSAVVAEIINFTAEYDSDENNHSKQEVSATGEQARQIVEEEKAEMVTADSLRKVEPFRTVHEMAAILRDYERQILGDSDYAQLMMAVKQRFENMAHVKAILQTAMEEGISREGITLALLWLDGEGYGDLKWGDLIKSLE